MNTYKVLLTVELAAEGELDVKTVGASLAEWLTGLQYAPDDAVLATVTGVKVDATVER